MNYKFTKKLKKKHKISSGTKENIDTIIDELSFITRRKGLTKNEPSKAITEAFNKADHHIAAISLILPEIDQLWQN